MFDKKIILTFERITFRNLNFKLTSLLKPTKKEERAWTIMTKLI